MSRKQKQGTWKPKPVKVHIVFRAYAVIFGLLGLMLLLWGPMWFGRNVVGVPFDGATLVRVFGSMFVTAACCAAVLSAMGDTLVRSRSLFWFAMGHAVVWLVALAELTWVWGPGLGGNVVAVVGETAVALFCFWLTAEGEFPQEPYGSIGIFGPPVSTPSEPLRSQYEQKIRQAAAQEERKRLARDLHDSIKQQIFAIQTAAATVQTRFDGRCKRRARGAGANSQRGL